MTELPTIVRPTRSRRRAAAATAGAAGVAAVLALTLGGGAPPLLTGATEDVSGPCDEAEHATDPACSGQAGNARPDDGASTTAPTSSTANLSSTSTTTSANPTTGAAATPAALVRTVDAAGAGTVVVAVEGSQLRLISATPATGWRTEVEVPAGRQVEVDFRSGTRRVQVDLELEDGQVRERVRVRDDAAGTDVRTDAGAVVRSDDDSSGSGSSEERSGPGDDSSGSGDDDSSGRDHPEDDGTVDDDRSGSDDRDSSGRDHPEGD